MTGVIEWRAGAHIDGRALAEMPLEVGVRVGHVLREEVEAAFEGDLAGVDTRFGVFVAVVAAVVL